MGWGEGRKRVQRVRLPSASRSGRMPSRRPSAMIVSIPSAATLRAMRLLVSIPPRPNDDFASRMQSGRSRCPGAISRITSTPGAPGIPSQMPSTLVSRTSASAPIIVESSPESSSLSVNINSVTATVSFSLTIGTTPFSSITRMLLRWLR